MVAAMVQCVRYYRERRHLLAAVLGVSAYDADAHKFRDGQLQRFIDKAEVWLCGEQEAGRTPLDLDATTAARVFVWGGYQAVAG